MNGTAINPEPFIYTRTKRSVWEPVSYFLLSLCYLALLISFMITTYYVYFHGMESILEFVWYGKDGADCGAYDQYSPVLKGAE